MKTNDNEKRPLPPGWAWTTIGEVAAVNYRDPAIRDMPDDLEITFVPMAAVDEIEGKIANPQLKTLGKTRKGYTPFSNGDVIFAKITPCMENGKAAIARNLRNGLGFGSTEFHVMKPGAKVTAEWLFYYVRQSSFRSEAKANFSGTAGQLRVKKDFIVNYPLPVAPLPEQERIVAEIEKQFTRLDQAVASLRRLQEQLARYKASLLKAACNGRLVPQDPHDEPADQLLQRILAERRAQWQAANPGKKYKEPAGVETADLPDLPQGWVWTSTEQLANVLGGVTKNAKRGKLPLEMPYLRVANVYANQLDLDDIATIGVSEGELGRVLLQKNDMLVVEGNGSIDQIGRVALWDASIDPCVHQNHIIKARFVETDMAKFVLYWLLSPGGRRAITEVASSTSGLYTLSLSKVNALPVPLPSLAEQQRIVEEVERRLSVVAAADAAVAANLTRSGRLRQAILHQAFNGRLV